MISCASLTYVYCLLGRILRDAKTPQALPLLMVGQGLTILQDY